VWTVAVILISAETICVHSDTPGDALIGPEVRAVLDESGVTVSAP
jgi:lactam utilization protein B